MKHDAQTTGGVPAGEGIPAGAGVGPVEILDFWFGELRDGWTAEDRFKLWFGGAEHDGEIVRRFGGALALAERGALDDWAETPTGTLALIVLLDQFTRAARRGAPGAFANDARALALAESALARGWDAQLPPAHRQFLMMPLMHSEDLARQERSAALFAALAEELRPTHREAAEGMLFHAREHRDIVAKFGRFPHRNQILGRDNTPAEAEWLAANAGKNYGQSSG